MSEKTPHVTRRQSFSQYYRLYLVLQLVLSGCLSPSALPIPATPNIPTTPPTQTVEIPTRVLSPFLRDTSEEDLKYRESLQEKYEIQIRTLKEVYRDAGQDQEYQRRRDFMVQNGLPERWDNARLKMLDDYLAVLPPHFYAPDKNGRALRITLGWVSGAREDPISNEYDNNRTNQIELSGISHFYPNSRLAFPKLAHEFIHVVVPGNYIQQGKDLNLISPWDDEMGKILGGDFVTIHDRYAQKAKQATASVPKGHAYKEYLGVDMQYGLQASFAGFTGKSFSEWYPVLGEHYILGESKFLDIYKLVFSPVQSKQLYDFTKKEIFHGIEYKSLLVRK